MRTVLAAVDYVDMSFSLRCSLAGRKTWTDHPPKMQKPAVRLRPSFEAEDHKKELTMVVTVCGHMPNVKKIAWVARHEAWDVFAKWRPESLHLAYRSLLEENASAKNISADDYVAKLPSFKECADLVDVVQNSGYKYFISEVLQEAVAGSHRAVDCMKYLTHIKCTLKDYRATLLPDL